MKTLLITLMAGTALTGVACPSGPSDTSASGPGNHYRTLEVDALQRTYILHVPPDRGDRKPLPLLLVLHGGGGSGRRMQRQLGFDGYADTRGFLVAYPDAYDGGHWNDGRGTTDSAARGVDDVRFLVALVEDVSRQVSVDAARVYVTGASNGGMMTWRLCCGTSGVFAGFAPVIANMPAPLAETCRPRPGVPFLTIVGDADALMPFSGGTVCGGTRIPCQGGEVLSSDASVAVLAAAAGCRSEPVVETLPVLVDDGTTVEKRTFTGCTDGSTIVQYVIHDGGHAWPPHGPRLPLSGISSKNLDATATIVDFFFPRE